MSLHPTFVLNPSPRAGVLWDVCEIGVRSGTV